MNLYVDRDTHIDPFLGISGGAYATATITYGVPVNGDTVTVNGTTFTKVASGATSSQFSSISDLATKLNALANISVVSDGSILTLTADAVGTAGNAYTLARAGTGTMAVSGATFSGGVNGDTSKDALLNMLNTMCTQLLNSILNVSDLAFHTVTDERVDGDTSEVWCKDFPVLSVTSIKQGSLETLYTQTEAYIFERNRVKINGVLGGGKGYEQCKITYTAGYYTWAQTQDGATYSDKDENMPEDLKLAVLLLIAGLYNQRNNMGVSSFSIQGKSVTLRNEIEVKEFETIVNRYKKLQAFAL